MSGSAQPRRGAGRRPAATLFGGAHPARRFAWPRGLLRPMQAVSFRVVMPPVPDGSAAGDPGLRVACVP